MTTAAAQRVQLGVIAFLVLAMFWHFFPVMEQKWAADDSYYSHGYLIPFVSAFLIWRMREKLAALPRQPSWLGLPVVLLGALLRVFCAYKRVTFLSGFSLIILLVGIVLFLWGRKVAWKLLFPLLFLSAMIPLPGHTITHISYQLKTFASEVASRLLPLIGITVDREGSTIHFWRPVGKYDFLIIDDVCSGLRSMIALLAFGAVFAYITPCRLRNKLELFAASVPCSVIANMCRIVFITVIAYFWGGAVATKNQYIPNPFGKEGYTIHDATGISIFVIAFIGFFTYEKLLNRPPFRLPWAKGPRTWLLDLGGRIVGLAGNQLQCLLDAGHLSGDDQIRAKDAAVWSKVRSLPQFAASPRNRMLRILPDPALPDAAGSDVSFHDCIRMARDGRLGKDQFLAYSDGGSPMRAGNLDFLRPHWPAGRVGIALDAALYAVLPVVLFILVRRDEDLKAFGSGTIGVLLITIVAWFLIRFALLLAALGLRAVRPPEKALPALPRSARP